MRDLLFVSGLLLSLPRWSIALGTQPSCVTSCINDYPVDSVDQGWLTSAWTSVPNLREYCSTGGRAFKPSSCWCYDPLASDSMDMCVDPELGRTLGDEVGGPALCPNESVVEVRNWLNSQCKAWCFYGNDETKPPEFQDCKMNNPWIQHPGPINYIPFYWSVWPNATDGSIKKCPSHSQIIGTFAATNIISAISIIFTGHRLVTKRLTCGLLGRRDSTSWMFMWIPAVTLQLSANVLIASLIKATAGYGSGFSVAELAFFLCVRPRMNWIMAIGVLQYSRRGDNNAAIENLEEISEVLSNVRAHLKSPDSMALNETRSRATALPLADTATEEPLADHCYASSALTILLSEFVLQGFCLYTMGRTIHVFRKRFDDSDYDNPPPDAYSRKGYQLRMAAVMWFVSPIIFVAVGFVTLFLYNCIKRRIKGRAAEIRDVLTESERIPVQARSHYNLSNQLRGVSASSFPSLPPQPSKSGQWARKFILLGWLYMVSVWLACWLYIDAFVELAVASQVYCPPNLITQAAIWIGAAAGGGFLGTGL